MGLFDRFKQKVTSIVEQTGLNKLTEGLKKTRNAFVNRLRLVLGSGRKIDAQLLSEIEEILITSDIGVHTTLHIMNNVKDIIKKEGYEDSSEIYNLIKQEILAILSSSSNIKHDDYYNLIHNSKPHIIMMVGVNGVGKTTTIGKLAYNFKQKQKRVLIGAADTFRAAANEQLEVWAQRADVEIIQQKQGSDPAAVAFDTVKAGLSRNVDVIIIDTAGRLHNKTGLMQELEKISRVIQKLIPDAPHEVLLALDATTGQNGLAQAKIFGDAVGLSGVVVTKLDGSAKGGIAFAIERELGAPIKFVGTGEGISDLQPFEAAAYVSGLISN